MRGTWWKIAKLELTLAARDRESLLWSLVAPIVMAWIFGSMFGSDGPPEPTHVRINVGANPPALLQQAQSYFATRDFVPADDGIEVVLPDSMFARIEDGRPLDVRVLQGEAGTLRAQSVSASAREFCYFAALQLEQVGGDVRPRFPRPAESSTPGRHPQTTIATSASDSRYLSVVIMTLGAAPKVATGKERMLPAMLIMYIMFQVMTFFLSLWVDDLRSGKIKRIVMSPVTPRDILLGEIAARLVWAGLQVIVILGVGSLLLGVRLDVNWLYFGMVVLAFMLSAAAIGMMAASFFRSSEKAGAIGVVISLVLAALGGCWWPLEIVPGAMRAVALALPTGQAMNAIGEMLALGPGAPFPHTAITVLLIMATVAMMIAARRMRVQLVQ